MLGRLLPFPTGFRYSLGSILGYFRLCVGCEGNHKVHGRRERLHACVAQHSSAGHSNGFRGDHEQVRPDLRRCLACCVATVPICLSMPAADSYAECIEDSIWFHAPSLELEGTTMYVHAEAAQ